MELDFNLCRRRKNDNAARHLDSIVDTVRDEEARLSQLTYEGYEILSQELLRWRDQVG